MLLWLACSVETMPVEDRPLPYVVEVTPDTFNPSLTETELRAVEDQLQQLFDHQRMLSGAPILRSQEQIFVDADEHCPSTVVNDGNAFWVGYCTSEAGLYLNGYLFYNVDEDADLNGDGSLWDIQQLSGSMDAISATGRSAHWGGAVTLGTAIDAQGNLLFSTSISGSFMDSASTTAWLQEGISTELSLFGIQYPIADETRSLWP